MRLALAIAMLAACTYDPRQPGPDDPATTVTLVWWCEAYGCGDSATPPTCDARGACVCDSARCFVPACDLPDEDHLYELAVVQYASDGSPCLHDNNEQY